jgi:hypothetical protein
LRICVRAGPKLPEVKINGARRRLDAARNGLSPDTGSSIYRLDRQDLDNLPLGDSTPLNRVILQTPGVVQDSYGQLHVRGDHANVQYRINGVIIPESISGFGQALETRFADHLSILTGALPAQYGYRNAAVVDIQSKGEDIENGGSIGFTVGGRGHAETTGELSGTRGPFSYYLTGSYLRSLRTCCQAVRPDEQYAHLHIFIQDNLRISGHLWGFVGRIPTPADSSAKSPRSRHKAIARSGLW